MSIYNKNKDNIGIFTEDEIFKNTLNDFKETLVRIINQNETKEPFFEIKNIDSIMKSIRNPKNDLKKEIEFLSKEFEYLNKNNYIKNNLLRDLINYSQRDKIKNIFQGITDLIEAYQEISGIQSTHFTQYLRLAKEKLMSRDVNQEDIKSSKSFLLKQGYDIDKNSALLNFYELFIDKKKSVTFFKTILEKNIDVRFLNELIDESDSSELNTSNIDDLLYVNLFFTKLLKNKEIKTDEDFFVKFKREFEAEKNIPIKFNLYLQSYGEIIGLYEKYNKNPEMTIEIIRNILKDSRVILKNDENSNYLIFSIEYKKQGNELEVIELNELDELRNKMLLSTSNNNFNKKEDDQEKNILDKAKLTKEFVNLIDNIKQLNQTMNNLLKSGYFKINNISLKSKMEKL